LSGSLPTIAIVTLSAVLVDVGGTLWPDAWPVDEVARAARVEAVVPGASDVLPQLLERLEHRADADQAVFEVLTAHALAVDKETAVSVRKAICSPFRPLGEPVPGAHELLVAIRRLGKRCVLVSNVSVRDAELYAIDLSALGWGELVDDCITSIDAGCRKPGAAIFDAALEAARCSPAACVMIGNSEDKDIEPARVRGMRTVRIAPPTVTSVADVVVGGPAECISLLERWST
jgi:FMN phosphatase YigB (HAD superfamily)